MSTGAHASTLPDAAEFLRQRTLGLQNEVLEKIATGGNLAKAMEMLCRRVEDLVPDIVCSVLTVDAGGLMHPLAAPSLPQHYSDAINGIAMGPKAGSCGTAAWRGEAVLSYDIATDPLWDDFRHLIMPLGFRACWSSPIKSHDGRVIGTFAFYYRAPTQPAAAEREIVKTCVHLCTIAIEHDTARAQIHRLAFFDLVTGLPNRASFQVSATQAITTAVRSSAAAAVLYIDVDDFKGVNDTLGHRTGDLLLEEIAARLSRCLAGNEILARLGGDEFAILKPFETVAEVRQLAERLVDVAAEPIEVEGHVVPISVSVGIALAPEDGRDLDELLRNADMALYRAKADGRATFAFYASEMFDRVQFRRAVERDLRAAVQQGQFELLYQPMVDLKTGRINGLEALIRWHHPTRGIVPPSDFIPLAEELDLIGPVGDWALRRACDQAADWPADVALALNLSPRQFYRPGFALKIIAALNETRMLPKRLELEITETAILADEGPVRAALEQLHAYGVRISLDDFGTGYSSLRSLRSFPIDKIKIDKSFVADVCVNPGSAAIVRTLITLARDLGMRSTAEGVETAEQCRALRSFGCTEAQGYYFSRPLTVSEVLARLKAGDRHSAFAG
jgi:diguanylate cyclase (GGDEF)-like protein